MFNCSSKELPKLSFLRKSYSSSNLCVRIVDLYYAILYNMTNPEVVKKKKEEIRTNLQIFEEKLQSKYFAGESLTRCREELPSFHSSVETGSVKVHSHGATATATAIDTSTRLHYRLWRCSPDATE